MGPATGALVGTLVENALGCGLPQEKVEPVAPHDIAVANYTERRIKKKGGLYFTFTYSFRNLFFFFEQFYRHVRTENESC